MNNTFYSLRIRKKVVLKFRRFSKQLNQTQSETLNHMIHFFEFNQLSPFEDFGPNITKLENLFKKRTNAIIAIIRDIEKNQSKPAYAMLSVLFEEFKINPNSDNKSESKKKISAQLIKYQEYYRESEKKHLELVQLTSSLLHKIKLRRTSFGKKEFFIHMKPEELQELKLKIEKHLNE